MQSSIKIPFSASRGIERLRTECCFYHLQHGSIAHGVLGGPAARVGMGLAALTLCGQREGGKLLYTTLGEDGNAMLHVSIRKR